MAGGKMHTFHPTSLDPPQVISYRNHQKNLAYFSHLAPLVLFYFTKRPSQRGGGGLWPNGYGPNGLWPNSINNKNAVQAKHIRRVGLPVLLHRIVTKLSKKVEQNRKNKIALCEEKSVRFKKERFLFSAIVKGVGVGC